MNQQLQGFKLLCF